MIVFFRNHTFHDRFFSKPKIDDRFCAQNPNFNFHESFPSPIGWSNRTNRPSKSWKFLAVGQNSKGWLEHGKRHTWTSPGDKDGPRAHQDATLAALGPLLAALGPPRVPRTPPGVPKMPPRGSQDAPKRPQDAPKRPQDAPKEAPRRPQEPHKSSPRAPQEAPRPLKKPPRGPKSLLKGPQEASSLFSSLSSLLSLLSLMSSLLLSLSSSSSSSSLLFSPLPFPISLKGFALVALSTWLGSEIHAYKSCSHKAPMPMTMLSKLTPSWAQILWHYCRHHLGDCTHRNKETNVGRAPAFKFLTETMLPDNPHRMFLALEKTLRCHFRFFPQGLGRS